MCPQNSSAGFIYQWCNNMQSALQHCAATHTQADATQQVMQIHKGRRCFIQAPPMYDTSVRDGEASPETFHEQCVQLGQRTDVLGHLLKTTAVQLQVAQLHPVADAFRQADEGTRPY